MPDYCTGAPDGPAKPCCKQHDEDYAAQIPRKGADLKFYRCMKSRGLWFRAPIYYLAVRIFGGIAYSRSKR